MQIGIYEKAINNKFNWREKIQIAKKAGFDFIEFSVDESQERLERLDWSNKKINNLRKTLIEEGFYFNSMALSGLRKYPYGSSSASVRKKAILVTKKAILLAKKLGIRMIQLAGYDVYYEKANQNSKKHFLESVKKVIKIANEHSVMLSFEIMDTKFMGTISNYYKVLENISSPWLKIYPDIGNLWQWSSPDIEKELLLGQNDIIGLHFKDTKPNVFRDVPFGEGTVDFKQVFAILKKIKYNGPFLIEMWSKNKLDETISENVSKIKSALEFFKKEKQNV